MWVVTFETSSKYQASQRYEYTKSFCVRFDLAAVKMLFLSRCLVQPN